MREIERQIIEKIVDSALAAEFILSVWDGMDWAVERSADKDAIMKEVAATDVTFLYVYDSAYRGWIMLVHGNDCDVITDHIDNDTIQGLLVEAEALADKFRGGE